MPSVETTPAPAKSVSLQMWAIVELMGHQRMAGEITEVTVAGHGFIRIDVPGTSKVPAFTRMVSPSSIYAINPTTQELAIRAAEAFQPRPVQEWELPKALPPTEPSLKHLGTHHPDGTFAAADDDDHDEDCHCFECRFAAKEAATLASVPPLPSHAECAVCRKTGVPLFNCTDGLPRCRACGGDGA